MTDTIIEFADYLNKNGYAVTPDRIAGLFGMLKEDGADIENEQQIISIMKFLFCRTKGEADALPEYFRMFILEGNLPEKIEEKQEETERLQKHKEKAKQEYLQSVGKLKEEMDALLEKEKEEAEKTRKSVFARTCALTQKQREFLEKNRKWTSKVTGGIIDGTDKSNIRTSDELNRAEEEMARHLEKDLLGRNGTNKAEDYKKLDKIIGKLKADTSLKNKLAAKEIPKATQKIQENIKEIRNKITCKDQEQQRTQRQLDKKIKEINSEKKLLIKKEASTVHRKEFINPQNAVQAYGTSKEIPFGDKNFNSLSKNETAQLMQYIRDNLVKFKTRLNRNLSVIDNGKIDMLTTIQSACKTGGIPFTIGHTVKKPGKTDLILLLDVSGSCKAAASLMLTFMYLLKESFPRGCKAFAFVNNLYDITGVMDAANIENAVSAVMDTVPRAGQYSDYGRPIQFLWDNKRQEITKESVVIVMGDARNNKNDTAEEAWKNIVRRAKRTYWLNTDTQAWNTGDSVAGVYAGYCPMYPAKNVGQLVGFIENGMR